MTTPREALQELLHQHAEVRRMIGHCEALADGLDAGLGDAAELLREIVRLRITVEAHNHFEELFLLPILREVDVFGAIRMDQMLTDHAQEHRLMSERLAAGVTTELRVTLIGLREHLEGEERHFLSSKILR